MGSPQQICMTQCCGTGFGLPDQDAFPEMDPGKKKSGKLTLGKITRISYIFLINHFCV